MALLTASASLSSVGVAYCSCPVHCCGFFRSSGKLVGHFDKVHSWPITKVRYVTPYKIVMSYKVVVLDQDGWHVLIGEDDGSMFLVSVCTYDASIIAVSLLCVRASGVAVFDAS